MWVDDFVGIGPGEGFNGLAKSVDVKYSITGLGEVKWVLGMLIEWDRDTRLIYISQEVFINTVLARFNLFDAAANLLTKPLLLDCFEFGMCSFSLCFFVFLDLFHGLCMSVKVLLSW